MRTTKLLIITLSTALFITGCVKKLDYKEYFNFYNQFSEESFVEFSDSNYTYKLQYRPDEYSALCDIRSKKEKVTSKSLDNNLSNQTTSGQNFCLRIYSNNGKPILDEADVHYYEKVSQLTSDFASLVYCLTDIGDTALCRFSHFERSYNLQPFAQILFNINSKNSSAIKSVLFRDEIFNQGSRVEFQTKKYIKNLPKLKI